MTILRHNNFTRLLLSAFAMVILVTSSAAQPKPNADPKTSLAAWKTEVKTSAVAADDHHSIHAYFNTSPESPDGRWVLYYASTTVDSHDGEIRIRERATGKETVLARNISCEDAHRTACQQWVSGGRRLARISHQ